jgi:FkbM family methyltransferase
MRLVRRTSRWYRVKVTMERFGMLRGAAHFPFHATTVVVPMDEPEAWANGDFAKYNLATVRNFAAACDGHLGSFDLIDCGAHLGLFGAQVATFSRGLRRIVAVEPNPALFGFLAGNLLAGRTRDVQAVNAAVAGFVGRGRLVSPDYDPESNQALYLRPDPQGDIEVIRLDSLTDRVGPNLALKLDIEGAELEALQASGDFVRSRERLVICIEVHRSVLARVGLTDRTLLAGINDIRPMRWVDADHPERVVDPSRPVYEQVGVPLQCDLIGFSCT